jgi:uncharacterized protein YlzI (FlbEa/FlbD family)
VIAINQLDNISMAFLLQHGAHVNTFVNQTNETPLTSALMLINKEDATCAVTLLISYGAKFTFSDNFVNIIQKIREYKNAESLLKHLIEFNCIDDSVFSQKNPVYKKRLEEFKNLIFSFDSLRNSLTVVQYFTQKDSAFTRNQPVLLGRQPAAIFGNPLKRPHEDGDTDYQSNKCAKHTDNTHSNST